MMPYEAWRISYQSSEQAARDAYSFLQAAMRESETFKEEVEDYKRITAKLLEEACEYTNEIASLQAKIDELMLEYCPDEMSEDQKANWAECQRPVGYDIGVFEMCDKCGCESEGAPGRCYACNRPLAKIQGA